MAKGNKAKEYVAKKLAEIFGEDYIGLVDKKYYVWSQEDGQKMQVAIAMTCPKTPIECDSVPVPTGSDTWDFEDNVKMTAAEPVNEISEAEMKNISDLMARLGL